MKRTFLVFLCVLLLAGCGAEKFVINENYDPNRNSQVLVGKYEDFYVLNLTNGLYVATKDFSLSEQIVHEYCYNPYVVGNNVYFFGNDEDSENTFDGKIKCVDLLTGNSKWIYAGFSISYFAPLEDGFIVCDDKEVVKLREDGVRLFKYDIPDMGYGVYSDEKHLYYVSVPETKAVKMLDFETKKITELFEISDAHLASNILCDGANIYYTKRKDMNYYDFCKFDMNTKEHEIIVTDEFSEEFTVYDNICYYYSAIEDKKQYLKKVDIETKEITILKELENDIYDINILDDKLFYRNTYYGKQIEMFDLVSGNSLYLYELFK